MEEDTFEIDEIDRKILELLEQNSRTSFSELARYFNFSDVAIRKRVDKLQERGIIKRFTTVLDLKKLGKTVSAFIFFKTRSDKTREVADQLKKIDQIADLYISLGVYDIIALVHCQDVADLKAMTEGQLNDINGILEIRPSIVFSEVEKD